MASVGPSSLGLQQRLLKGKGRQQPPASKAPGARRVHNVYCSHHNGTDKTRCTLRAALALHCQERPGAARLLDGLDGLHAASSTSPRLKVAVDVDEVLGRFVHALNSFCKEEYGMQYAVHDYWIYEFAKIWNCSQDRSNHIVHEFFESPHFNDGIPIIPGAYESLQRLSSVCDLVVVTSRQHVIEDATLQWLDRHYGGVFSEVHFGNHFALSGGSRKKSDICRSIGAHVLIDDNPGYAVDCASNGIHVLLFDWHASYPWSKLADTSAHECIEVVHHWDHVEASLMALAATLPQRAMSSRL